MSHIPKVIAELEEQKHIRETAPELEREVAAYHEAGHAVAAIKLGVRINRQGVTIVPCDDYGGMVDVGKGFRGNPEVQITAAMRIGAEKRAITAFAGVMAQRRFPSSVYGYDRRTGLSRCSWHA